MTPRWLRGRINPFAGQFYTRMLFSCLVDADFLDTEQFMQGDAPRGGYDDMSVLLGKLRHYIQPWMEHPSTGINQRRCTILRDCLRAGEEPRGLFTLTVPTGGGKTLSSLAFALAHAVKNGLDRVIYVIPYTSIIEQNAAVLIDTENGAEQIINLLHDQKKLNEMKESCKRLAMPNAAKDIFELAKKICAGKDKVIGDKAEDRATADDGEQ
jgi:CRISPR-associated endonuclease/helicase Cas3